MSDVNFVCYICYSTTDDYMICDTCDEYYCYDCSYSYTLHYQHEGQRCYLCAEQNRRKKLLKEDIRNNLITHILKD